MKTICLCIMLVLSISASAQVITLEPDKIRLKSGVEASGRIVKEDDKYLYFVSIDSPEEKKISKSAVDKFIRRDLWMQAFKYTSSGAIEYQEVVEVPGANKLQLYKAAREWFAKAYEDSKEVLEMDDRESGVLIGSGFSKVEAAQLWSSVKVEIKDGKYRYTLNEIKVKWPTTELLTDGPLAAVFPETGGKELTGYWKRFKEQTLQNLQALATNLKATMAKAGSNSDDW